jgi:hypothetical protein
VGVLAYSSVVVSCKLTVPWVSSRPVPFKVNVSARFPEAVALLAGERELRGH